MQREDDSGIGRDGEREIALHLLETLVNIVGDAETMTVELWKLHRIILVMRGIIVDADPHMVHDRDFDRFARALSDPIASECKAAREFRMQNGIGLMDLVLRDRRLGSEH